MQTKENTIVIGRRIPSQNTRDHMHPMERHRERNDWITLLRHCIGPMPAPPTEHQNIFITSYRAQLITDSANLVGGAKGLVDAMVHIGLMLDDSDRWVHISYEQKKCKRVDERTEIYCDLFWPVQPTRTHRKPQR